MAKDRSKKPLASLGRSKDEPWRDYAGMATPTEKAAPSKLRAKLQAEKATDTTQVIPMTTKMSDVMRYAHQQLPHLDPWGQKFVASLDAFIAKAGGLTQRQWAKLQEVLHRT